MKMRKMVKFEDFETARLEMITTDKCCDKVGRYLNWRNEGKCTVMDQVFWGSENVLR